MKNLRYLLFGLMTIGLFLTSCDDDESSVEFGTMRLQMSSLTTPGTGYVYGVWLKENSAYTFLGDFTLTSTGTLSRTLYSIESQRLQAATGVMITLENEGEIGDNPSATRILAGDFISKGARLTTDHVDALNVDFSSSAASYILATPTDNDTSNEQSGIWYYDTMTMASTLDLPALPSNWIYESWLLVGDSLTSMGKFDNPLAADQNNSFGAGINPGFNAPGGDFLQGRADFPADLREGQIYISVEPIPDDATSPFAIRPLSAAILDSIPTMPTPLEYADGTLVRGLAVRG